MARCRAIHGSDCALGHVLGHFVFAPYPELLGFVPALVHFKSYIRNIQFCVPRYHANSPAQDKLWQLACAAVYGECVFCFFYKREHVAGDCSGLVLHR